MQKPAKSGLHFGAYYSPICAKFDAKILTADQYDQRLKV